jgi:hypothetical protein
MDEAIVVDAIFLFLSSLCAAFVLWGAFLCFRYPDVFPPPSDTRVPVTQLAKSCDEYELPVERSA